MTELFEALSANNGGQMRSLLQALLNNLMKLERELALGAKLYEKNKQIKGYANGFKTKQLKSRLGELELEIPQVRPFFLPTIIVKGIRQS